MIALRHAAHKASRSGGAFEIDLRRAPGKCRPTKEFLGRRLQTEAVHGSRALNTAHSRDSA